MNQRTAANQEFTAHQKLPVRAEQKNELAKREILRMSNEESNRLTKECLRTALLQLMGEKPFDAITITELVRRSGVSRTAFYRNYATKEMILTEISNEFIQELTNSLSDIKSVSDSYQWYRRTFLLIREHSDVFCLLIQAHLPNETILGEDVLLEKIMPSSSPAEHYWLVILENAFFSILVNWFRGGMKESIEFMAQFCADTLPIRR